MSTLRIEPVGPSYRVTVGGVVFMFRDIRTDRDLSADVAISHDGKHLFRSTSTLSITGRNSLAKTALSLDGAVGDLKDWQIATYRAVEAVMDAVEQLAQGTDLRGCAMTSDRPAWTARPFWPDGAGFLIMPGEAGKSTIMRAIAVSIATGLEVIPGIVPLVQGGVLYVASEDPSERSHTASVEAICRGMGIDRATLPYPITLVPARGRPLHRLARSLAERASDSAAIVLDAQQGLLAVGDQGNIRDQAAMFWNAVDELDRPSFTIAHPNLDQARHWDKSDGRAAGSEVNRDRPRISWTGHWSDEPAAHDNSYRRFTLSCTKNNGGPHPAPISFGMAWQFPQGDNDSGVVTFAPCEQVERKSESKTTLTAALQDTIDAYKAGVTSHAALAERFGCSVNAAKQRLHRMHVYLAESGDE
jgi:hypothetical protein